MTSKTLNILIIVMLLLAISECLNLSKDDDSTENDDEIILNEQSFAMEPQDQTAIVGSRVTLPCRVNEKLGSLQWTKDDFGLGQHRNLSGFERYSMIGSDDEGDFSLDIDPVMLDDDAKYQCQVGPGPKGEPGIRSRYATLTVLVPPESPEIVQGEYLVTTEDREIELECISTGGKPAAEITWIDGFGNVLTKGIEYVKELHTDHKRFTAKSILKLTPKKDHHNTTFTCQAQNTADRSYRSAKLLLEVKYAPKVTSVIESGTMDNNRLVEGTDVHLSCHADGNPNILTYQWYIDQEEVIGDYTTEMIIHNISRKLNGAIVKCAVSNAVGKSEDTEILNVGYGPVFLYQPQSIEADFGTTITFTCLVDGNPIPEIQWVHEFSDEVLSTSANLTIKVSSKNIGRYYCKTKGHPSFQAEASIYLKRPPVITSHPIQFGVIDEVGRIDCFAFSIPKAMAVVWTFNGAVINDSSEDYSISEENLSEGVKSSLIVKQSESKHFGKYYCTVINSYGNATAEINFISQRSVPIIMVVICSITTLAAILLFVIGIVVHCKRHKRKQPPADVIPKGHCIKKDSQPYTDCYNKDTDNESYPISIGSRGTLGVPLAGPVHLNDSRYSTEKKRLFPDVTDNEIKETSPYVEYNSGFQNLKLDTSSNNSTATTPSTYTNDQTSLHKLTPSINDTDLRIANISPNERRLSTTPSGLLEQPLLQNSLMKDPRYSSTYGTIGYLRNSSLPPLPPPSTANPAATPAPPPYNACRAQSQLLNGFYDHRNRHSESPISSNNHTLPMKLHQQHHQHQQQQSQQNRTPVSALSNSNSGQFILSSHESLKKGALATHV